MPWLRNLFYPIHSSSQLPPTSYFPILVTSSISSNLVSSSSLNFCTISLTIFLSSLSFCVYNDIPFHQPINNHTLFPICNLLFIFYSLYHLHLFFFFNIILFLLLLNKLPPRVNHIFYIFPSPHVYLVGDVLFLFLLCL